MSSEKITLIKHKQSDEVTLIKYICDVCKGSVWSERYCPQGWCTTREDHDNTICPDCNPYIKRLKKPIIGKMKLVEAAYVPSEKQDLYGCY